MQKFLVFVQMSEFRNTVIKSCLQTLGQRDKYFRQYQFWCEIVNFGHQKCKYARNVDFCHIFITTKNDYVLAKHVCF